MIEDNEDRRMSPDLRKQLAMMVRNTQWSYAIFWTLSSTDAGVIKWSEGYYNGETRTSKTTKSEDVDTHLWGLQRSEQLRKLFESLIQGQPEQEKKKTTSATLTVEDLSDMEWFYLVCMSYSFKIGQSLPGMAYATGQHIWLCGAQSADSKVFARSLLAKSASVQTVICFPHMGGVIELGSTDLISEDLKLIERTVKAASQEVKETVCSQITSSAAYCTDYDQNHRGAAVDENGQRTTEDLCISSPDDCSIDCSHHLEESFTLHGSLSPCQNSHLSDHFDLRQCLEDSTPGYVCKSMLSCIIDNTDNLYMEAVQNGRSNPPQIETTDNIHCRNSLPVTLESMDRITEDRNRLGSQHGTCSVPFYGLEDEKENEQFMILRSIVPSITKADEASILSIESPDELEARIRDQLDFGMDLEGSSTTNGLEMLKNTSESYKMDVSYTNPSINNRKAYNQVKETQTGMDNDIQTEILQFIDIEVILINDEVLIKMNCPWRENLLLEIMKVLNNLNLDTHTVQSSTFGGALFVSLKSKLRGAEFVSEAMIKQALRRTISKYIT